MPNKEIFQVEKLPLDEFATSLGLAATPSLRFLKALKSKDRDEIRNAKNVNWKLHKLKQQIKAEKLQKKLEKLGKSADEIMDINSGKRKRSNEGDENDDDVLVVKKRHDWKEGDESDLPIVDVNQVTRFRSDKRIRIDGSTSGQNKKIVFNDNSDEDDIEIDATKDSTFGGEVTGSHELADANADYLRRVRERLNKTKDLDRTEEKERIREKHKKQKLKEKALANDDEGETEEMMVTLATSDIENENSANDDSDSEDSESSNSESEDDGNDLKAKEDLALALIHGKT